MAPLTVAEIGPRDLGGCFGVTYSGSKKVSAALGHVLLHVMFDAIGQFTILTARILRVGGAGQVFVGLTIETSQKIHGFVQMPYQRTGTEARILPNL